MLMPTIVTHFQETDVLLGRTKQCRGHPGNARFRGVLDEFGAKYHLLKSRSGRSRLVDQVEKRVVGQGWRFLKFEAGLGVWREANKKEIREKISHGFRDRKRQSMSTIANKVTASSRNSSRSDSPNPPPTDAEVDFRFASEMRTGALNIRVRKVRSMEGSAAVESAGNCPTTQTLPMKNVDSVPFNLAECLLSLRASHLPTGVTPNKTKSRRTMPATNASNASKQDSLELDKIKELRRLLSKRTAGALERATSSRRNTDGHATPKMRNTLKHDRMHGSILDRSPTKRQRVNKDEAPGKFTKPMMDDPSSMIYPTKPATFTYSTDLLGLGIHSDATGFRRCPPTSISRLPFKKRHFIIGV